jgi:hypothetical protein
METHTEVFGDEGMACCAMSPTYLPGVQENGGGGETDKDKAKAVRHSGR